MTEYCKVCNEEIKTILGLVIFPSYKFNDGYYCSRCGKIKKDKAIEQHNWEVKK